MKNVIINADDYAMDADIDDAIAELCGRGVVTATSAMVLSPSWSEAGRRLADLELDRGLHLDLTSEFARGHGFSSSLSGLISQALTQTLDRRAVRTAIKRQLDAFDAVLKAPPHFVDGHQHVHQLPIIATQLLRELKERYGPQTIIIGFRMCYSKTWRGIKAEMISHLRSSNLRGRVWWSGHPANSDFAGVYDFNPAADLPKLWSGWLSQLAGDKPLIMCHPAKPGKVHESDPIRAARMSEFNFMASSAFRDLLAACNIQPSRWHKA